MLIFRHIFLNHHDNVEVHMLLSIVVTLYVYPSYWKLYIDVRRYWLSITKSISCRLFHILSNWFLQKYEYKVNPYKFMEWTIELDTRTQFYDFVSDIFQNHTQFVLLPQNNNICVYILNSVTPAHISILKENTWSQLEG